MTLQDRIASLDAATARRILDSIARARSNRAETALTAELRQALRDFASEPETAAVPASDGELTRAALLLLADDPQQQPILRSLVEGPAPAQFGPVKNAAVVAAVLFVLQLYVRFEYDKDGRWSVEIIKEPADKALLMPVVQKLLNYAPSE